MGKMSNMKTTVLLALKNLTRQKRRSLMLALAISFGFFIVTAIDGIASGAMKNLVEHIVQMQGGNVIVQGLIHQTGEDGEIIKKYSFVKMKNNGSIPAYYKFDLENFRHVNIVKKCLQNAKECGNIFR